MAESGVLQNRGVGPPWGGKKTGSGTVSGAGALSSPSPRPLPFGRQPRVQTLALAAAQCGPAAGCPARTVFPRATRARRAGVSTSSAALEEEAQLRRHAPALQHTRRGHQRRWTRWGRIVVAGRGDGADGGSVSGNLDRHGLVSLNRWFALWLHVAAGVATASPSIVRAARLAHSPTSANDGRRAAALDKRSTEDIALQGAHAARKRVSGRATGIERIRGLQRGRACEAVRFD